MSIITSLFGINMQKPSVAGDLCGMSMRKLAGVFGTRTWMTRPLKTFSITVLIVLNG